MAPDEQQRENLIVEHIPFAKSLAAQFYRQRGNIGFDREDYEGAAMLGLCDAARRFDVQRGEYFKTYCYFRIRGAMFDLLRNGAGVQRRHFNKMVPKEDTKDAEGMSAKNSTEDSERLPYSFAKSARELVSLINVLDGLSMSANVSEAGGVDLTYLGALNPEEHTALDNSRHYMQKLINALPEKERAVIARYYYEGQNLSDIGRDLGGISRSWVCRLHATALDRLRKMVESDCDKYAEHFVS